MQGTKNDLCFNTVTLDYSELIKTARVAVRYSLDVLHGRMRQWYDLKKRPTNLDAEWLLNDAQALATSTAMLHYLEEGSNREEVKVVRNNGSGLS